MSQIRLQPVVVQNVTTYGTIIDVPNAQLKLKPGMTANLKVEIAKRDGRAARAERGAALPADRPTCSRRSTSRCRPKRIGRGGRGGRGGRRPGRRPQRRRPTRRRATAAARRRAAPDGGAGAHRHAPSRAAAPVALRQAAGADGRASGGRGGGGRGFDPARMLERFKAMSPDEQKQFIARMKERGQDTSAFEKELPAAAPRRPPRAKPKTAPQSAQTIDALFAPLPPVESRGRAGCSWTSS